jgi:hypothetical protein
VLQDPFFTQCKLTCLSSQTDGSTSVATCIPHVQGSEASRDHAYVRRIARCVYPKRCNPAKLCLNIAVHTHAASSLPCEHSYARLSEFLSVSQIDATYTLFVSSLAANQDAELLLQSCNSKCTSDSRWGHRGRVELRA